MDEDTITPVIEPQNGAYIVPSWLLVEMMKMLVMHPYGEVAPLLAELNECERVDEAVRQPA